MNRKKFYISGLVGGVASFFGGYLIYGVLFADVLAKNKKGRTPLHAAADIGNLAAVEYLLSVGADVEAKDKEGNTARILANKKSHLSVVKAIDAYIAVTEA